MKRGSAVHVKTQLSGWGFSRLYLRSEETARCGLGIKLTAFGFHDVTVIRECLIEGTIPEWIRMVESEAKDGRVFSHTRESDVPDRLFAGGESSDH